MASTIFVEIFFLVMSSLWTCNTLAMVVFRHNNATDSIKHISKDDCTNLNGIYDNESRLCRCPTNSTFMSGKVHPTQPRCIAQSQTGCLPLPTLGSTDIIHLLQPGCERSVIQVWNTNINEENHLWYDVTSQLLRHFEIKNPFVLGFSKNISKTLLEGQIFKIKLKCKKCYIIRELGQRSYPFQDDIFDIKTTPSTPTSTISTQSEGMEGTLPHPSPSNKPKVNNRFENITIIICLVAVALVLLLALVVFIYMFRHKLMRDVENKNILIPTLNENEQKGRPPAQCPTHDVISHVIDDTSFAESGSEVYYSRIDSLKVGMNSSLLNTPPTSEINDKDYGGNRVGSDVSDDYDVTDDVIDDDDVTNDGSEDDYVLPASHGLLPRIENKSYEDMNTAEYHELVPETFEEKTIKE